MIWRGCGFRGFTQRTQRIRKEHKEGFLDFLAQGFLFDYEFNEVVKD